jgi:hypothetical protein
MRYLKKQSKEKKRERLENLMSGTGLYLYENNTDADLSLPKPSLEGFKSIGPRKRFKGDSYFMSLVKTPLCLLRLIEEIETENNTVAVEEEKKEEKKEVKLINSKRSKKSKKSKRNKKVKKMKEKLVLDQPDVVTQAGKVEQNLDNQESQKEENIENQEEKLLIENPSGNIEIISE